MVYLIGSKFFSFKRGVILIAFLIAFVYLCMLLLEFKFSDDYIHSTFTGFLRTQTTRKALNKGCQQLNLNPFNPDIMKFIKDVPPIKCSDEADWLEIRNGKVKFTEEILNSDASLVCTITYLIRVDDNTSRKGKRVQMKSKVNPEISLEEDFFTANCINESNSKSWRNIMAAIHRDESSVERLKKRLIESKQNLEISNDIDGEQQNSINILIFGFDSVSRMQFMRKMRKTYNYLIENMNAVVLESYNIVGDGTPQALIPILTGFSEPELPETRKRFSNAQYVNVYPFIWKNFSENGYITSYVEDGSGFGTFSYRLKGFNEKPTNHFGRQFYVEAEKEYRRHKTWCLGSKPRHKIMQDWTKQLYDVYPDVPKFAFGFHSELSHDDFNDLAKADEDTVDWLKSLENGNYLENTILIVMSDHGNRFSVIRETQQGKLEERLPFFSFILPKWFKKRFPKAYNNFNVNARSRLLTPFDIHATFLSVIMNFNKGYDASEKDLVRKDANGNLLLPRSMSLFEPIPEYRDCTMAGIDSHWCTCLKWDAVSFEDEIVKKAAKHLIGFINDLSKDVRQLCLPLTVGKITRAESALQSKELLSFKQSKDKDGFVADLTGHTDISQRLYQLQVIASPSQAIYEASLQYDNHKNEFTLKETQISRVNAYGNQPHCIINTHQELRKYCYCRQQL